MCKRFIVLLMAIVMMLLLCSCSADAKNDRRSMSTKEFDDKWKISRTAETGKIILDVDLMYVNDDAYAALIAAQADTLG